MAKETVGAIKHGARSLLGGRDRVYTDEYLQEPFALAFGEMYDAFLARSLPAIEIIVAYTLPAGTTSLDPATAGITNMGEIARIEERPSSAEKYTEVLLRRALPDDDMDSYLRYYEWRGDVLYFVGATREMQLRITYYSSGEAPTDNDSVIAIDGSGQFLKFRTAAIAGPAKGDVELARHWDLQARGRNPDTHPGGALHRLLNGPVKSLRKTPTQQEAYSAGNVSSRHGGRPPVYIDE